MKVISPMEALKNVLNQKVEDKKHNINKDKRWSRIQKILKDS